MISHFRKDLSIQKALFIVKIKWYDVCESALQIVKYYPYTKYYYYCYYCYLKAAAGNVLV